MKRRKNLGSSEGEHLEWVHFHLDDERTHVENAKLELAAGDCHEAIRQIGYATRSHGVATGHVQGLPDGKIREGLATKDMVRAMVDTNKTRDEIIKRCSLRKARGAR